MKFEEALSDYFNCIKSHNKNGFEKYINEDEKFFAMLPGPKIIESAKQFKVTHSAWFDDTSNKFDFKITYTRSNGNVGVGAVSAIAERSSKPVPVQILCIFILKKNWYVEYIQNTVLKPTDSVI